MIDRDDDEVIQAIYSIPTHYAGEAAPVQTGSGGGEGAIPAMTPPSGGTPAPAPPSGGSGAATPPPAPSPAPHPATPGTPAATAAQQFALRQWAEANGVPGASSRWKNDEDLAREMLALANTAPQYRDLAQVGRRFQPHIAEIEEFLRQRAAGPAQPAPGTPPAQKWWNAPEWKDEWLQQVTQDAQGRLVAKPGAPLDIPIKIEQYREFQRRQLDSFMQDPMKVLGPGLQETMMPLIKQAIQESLGGFSQAQQAQTYVNQNLSWLVQQQNGIPMRDPVTNNYVLTPAGQRFLGYAQELEKAGMTDVAMQRQIAERLVYADLLHQAHPQRPAAPGTPPAPAPAAPGNALAGLNGAAALPGTGAAPPPVKRGIKDMLSEALAQVPESDFASMR